jgi:hypothetical protein
MGAYGEDVWFSSFGVQKMYIDDCDSAGFFFTVMGYREEGCPDGEPC